MPKDKTTNVFQNCPCMDHCQNGCPCDDFDCDLALNVTDPVYGLESIGIMESVGQFHSKYNFFDSKILF